MRQKKSSKLLECNIICQMEKEAYDAINISSGLSILKIYSIEVNFMLDVELLCTKEHTFS